MKQPINSGIRPGSVFVDDRGTVAQLHGIGIQKVGDRWYAWGENKMSGATFGGIDCYSSHDLVSWKFVGRSLEVGDGDLARDRIVERPKVMQHPAGYWVMLVHIDSTDYAEARLGWAVADGPSGAFQYRGSNRPLGNLSRDIGVYIEGDEAFVLSEDRDGGLRIYRLRDDWLGVDSLVVSLRQDDRPEYGYESPALIRHEGRYYLFGSDLTGWSMNDNKYATAPNLTGPWSTWQNIAPAGSRTFDSQVSVVVHLGGDDFLYVGDRWLPETLADSPAVWLPLRIENARVALEWVDEWTPGRRPS